MDYKYSTKNGEAQAFLRKAADKNVFSSRIVFQAFLPRDFSPIYISFFFPRPFPPFSPKPLVYFYKKETLFKKRKQKNPSFFLFFKEFPSAASFPFVQRVCAAFLQILKNRRKAIFRSVFSNGKFLIPSIPFEKRGGGTFYRLKDEMPARLPQLFKSADSLMA